MSIKCNFEVSVLDGGKVADAVRRMTNSIVYEGYDLLAKMATTDMHVNGMYVEFKNGTPADPSPIAATRNRAYYAAYEEASYAGDQGYVRVPLTIAPEYSASSAEYAGNKVVLLATTDPTAAGKVAVQDGVSQFFTISLVHMADAADASKDIVYDAAVMKSGGVYAPLLKPANVQIGVKATILFEATP